MGMLDGVSQCWWLSENCVVNWDAWSAIGTVAAVFAAVLAPAIQRRFVRRKSNALFLFSYMSDVVDALACLRRLDSGWPIKKDVSNAEQVAAAMQIKGNQELFAAEMKKAAGRLAAREVDPAKWPAVDVELAASMVMAIESVKAVLVAATVIPTLDGDKLDAAFVAIRNGLDAAIANLAEVEKEGGQQVLWLLEAHARRRPKH
ncbi:hypothetical protein VDF74_06520 [Xanthomonas campestris pv. raphani]|uniref:hypothetical protein n=1 Tax=Xanthomonas campestris TaxID=339 RepID=UPI002B23B6F2|nr:hypothetical protein [Xanthomonas campestris]MEA9738644.1 hypothetical protein [Xanthomonas campestris pv. raphani]